MISDVLSDAIADIRKNYLMMSAYDDMRDRIEVVLRDMEDLRIFLDTPVSGGDAS